MSIVPRSVKKIPAGLLAIFLGSFGLHKFFLGRTNAGIALLTVHGLGWLIGFLPLVGWIGRLAVSMVFLLTFIEGIVLLLKSDRDFYHQYVMGRREWF